MRLFVYGTLLEASDTAWARWLLARVRRVRRGSVPGRLFAIRTRDGCYPALVAGRAGERVWGALCELQLRPGDLKQLDRYEGREYRRAPAQVLVFRGAQSPRRIAAQTYRWQVRLPATALPIVDGDFLAWLAVTGSRAYASKSG